MERLVETFAAGLERLGAVSSFSSLGLKLHSGTTSRAIAKNFRQHPLKGGYLS